MGLRSESICLEYTNLCRVILKNERRFHGTARLYMFEAIKSLFPPLSSEVVVMDGLRFHAEVI